jgi:RNA polymerase sigma-70 factor (ECF subfamily)
MKRRAATRSALAAQALAHWASTYGFALALTRCPTRAEDLCQEAFLRLLEREEEVDRSRSLRPLILTIVRNLFVSETRRPVLRALDGGPEPRDRAAVGPDEAASRREEIDAVRRALAELPPDWRAALYLRDGLDLSYREVGEVLDKSVDVVRVTLHRARRRVRGLLGPTIREGTGS